MTLQGDLLMKGNGAHDGFIERSFFSQAWRQSSIAQPEVLVRDPENTYYSRSRRRRLRGSLGETAFSWLQVHSNSAHVVARV